MSARPVRERVFIDNLSTLRAYAFHRDALRVLDAAVGANPAVADEVMRLQERDVERYASIISVTPGYHPRRRRVPGFIARERDGRRAGATLDPLRALLG